MADEMVELWVDGMAVTMGALKVGEKVAWWVVLSVYQRVEWTAVELASTKADAMAELTAGSWAETAAAGLVEWSDGEKVELWVGWKDVASVAW